MAKGQKTAAGEIPVFTIPKETGKKKASHNIKLPAVSIARAKEVLPELLDQAQKAGAITVRGVLKCFTLNS